MSKEKIVCSKCGTPMNYHADKPDRSNPLTEPDVADPDLERIIEIHTCPNCKNIDVRKAT